MKPTPGTDSGYLAFGLLDELMRVLVAKDIITQPEIGAMFERLASGWEANPANAAGLRCAKFIRASILAE